MLRAVAMPEGPAPTITTSAASDATPTAGCAPSLSLAPTTGAIFATNGAAMVDTRSLMREVVCPRLMARSFGSL